MPSEINSRPKKYTQPHSMLVHTQSGNWLMGLDHRVWVKVGDHAVEKMVRDLMPGDKVLEQNTRIKLSLPQIHKTLLTKSTPYQAAHRQLYVYPHDAENPKTRFQLFLEKLLALHDFKGDPLDPRNRAKAAKHIRDILYEAGTRARKIFTNAIQREKGLGKFSGKATPDLKVLERSETTTSRWLSGETKLADPDDSRVLRLLASIAPDLFKEVFGRTGETRATAFRQLKTPTSQGWKSWREFGNKPL
ncbi:MAG TPA: hypothetical protein VI874_01775, partial [Candidatus Norongarragalinales archaeon]|nr:hypothetical protein [Candidatus Norongarragalinales archaeon]